MNTGTTPGLRCFHHFLVSSDEFLDHPHLMGFYMFLLMFDDT